MQTGEGNAVNFLMKLKLKIVFSLTSLLSDASTHYYNFSHYLFSTQNSSTWQGTNKDICQAQREDPTLSMWSGITQKQK